MTKSSCRIPLVVAVATVVMALNATPIRFGTWNIRLSSMDKWEKDPRFPKWEARMPCVMGLIEEKGFDLMAMKTTAKKRWKN